MRIAIDARWIFPEISGIGAYTREIIAQLCSMESEHEYLLLFDSPLIADRTAAETGFRERPNFGEVSVPYGVFSLRSQVSLPGLLARHRCDVYHSPNYMVPLLPTPFARRPAVITTMHDVIPLVVPGHAPKSRKTRLLPLFKAVMRRAARVSDAIITVSHRSREDIIQSLGLPPSAAERVFVVHNGVSKAFCPLPADTSDADTSDATRPRRLLYVGRADPYKNLSVLVAVLERLRQQCPFPVTLTIAGPRDMRYTEPEQLARELGVFDCITWTGYLEEPGLVDAYRQADVLVHPARYEGFGLQIAEAMACGIPVVSSNGGSLPEVAGDAALLVDPDDIEGYVRCVQDVLTNRSVANDLVERGLRHVAQFNWSRAARATQDVYEQTFQRRGAEA